MVNVPLVLHDGIFGKALRNGLSSLLVDDEVGGDGFWQIELHVRLLVAGDSLLKCSSGDLAFPTTFYTLHGCLSKAFQMCSRAAPRASTRTLSPDSRSGGRDWVQTIRAPSARSEISGTVISGRRRQ